MRIERYIAERAAQWDALVEASRNGTFLFMRGYMDYHSDRFCDHSLMAYDDKHKLVAVLPSNEVEEDGCKILCSHQGLTYGGWVMSRKLHAAEVMLLFDLVIDYLREQGFSEWRYKPVPTIYHRLPSQDDIYALWRHGAVMTVCNLSCSQQLDVDADQRISADASRRHRRKQAEMDGLRLLVGGKDLPADEVLRRFWPIMEANMMQRYGARPVHTLDEMLLLQRRFTRNIQCFLVTAPTDEGGTVDVAGEVLFVTDQVAHAQYGHASELGRKLGALDFLYLTLMDRFAEQGNIRYFDFGTSNEQGGRVLNETLIAQKEGFGGRGVAYGTFALNVKCKM